MFADGLSLLCKTGDGLAHAFVRVDLTNRYVTKGAYTANETN